MNGVNERANSFLNITANAFGVPLALGDEGKYKAIAMALADGVTRSGYSPTDSELLRAESVVRQLIELASQHELDPILGGYDRDRRSHIVAVIAPSSVHGECTEDRVRHANFVLDLLVAHLKPNPRDAGSL